MVLVKRYLEDKCKDLSLRGDESFVSLDSF